MKRTRSESRWAEHFERQWRIVALGVILGTMCATAGAQFDINKTGLHDGESVYGLHLVSGPYVNPLDVVLSAWGEADPDIFTNVIFSAYGLYSEPNLINTGAIRVNATGGNAAADDGPALAYVDEISGIRTVGDADNSGNVTITGAGGTASSSGGIASANTMFVLGLHAEGDANNTGTVTIATTGGTADSSSQGAYASVSEAAGVYAGGDIYNAGEILITAVGGTATSVDDAFAYSYAVGLDAQQTANNTGALSIAAVGGTATTNGHFASANALATAYGINSGANIDNTGLVTATAVAGTATATAPSDDPTATAYADTSAEAYGLVAQSNVNNDGNIIATATGGTAAASTGSSAFVKAEGIFAAMNVTNGGDITAVAAGGTADGNDAGDAHSEAFGIESRNAVTSGAISVTAIGGTAVATDAQADAEAYGILTNADVDNSGQIHVTALGGTVVSESTDMMNDTDASARTYGLFAEDGAIDNTAALSVLATGGSATDTALSTQHEVFAAAWAHGLALDEDAAYLSPDRHVHNSGNLTVAATGGNAEGSSGEVQATATAYGIEAPDGAPVVNSGRIDVTATGGNALHAATEPAGESGAYASAYAYGLESDEANVDNSGAITAIATGGSAISESDRQASALADAIAIHVSGNIEQQDAQVRNTGAIVVEAIGGDANSVSGYTSAYAKAQGFLTPNADVNNAGAVSVRAQAGTASGAGTTFARGDASGMYVEGGAVTNSGDVMVTSLGGRAITSGHGGNSYADASADIRGIAAEEMLNNTGNVTVIATGGTAVDDSGADAQVIGYGLRTFGTLNNSGDVLVTATGGTATGSFANAGVTIDGLSGFALNNTGAVTVIATGGTATGDGIADASISAGGIGGSSLVNSGDISVTAVGGTTNGADNRGDVFAVGIGAGGDVHNSGDVTVTATASEGSASQAYGIRMNSPGNLTNTGMIRVSGDTAYELSIASGFTTIIDTYNVTLDGDPNRASIGVADGATLALNDATLTVTAVDGETLWNTEYKLFEVEGAGAVDGNFAEARAVNPNTTATYHDQGTAGSADDTVSLAYTPGGSPALASAAVEKQAISLTTDVVNLHMTTSMLQNILSPSTSGLLADAGSTAESLALTEAASDKSAGIFLEPYYSLVDKDANPLGYDARLWGFSAGYERFLGATLLGFHAGFGKADIDYTGAGYRGNSEEQDIVTAGFSGLTRWDPWLLRYGLTGFYGGHDYFGLTGLNLDEHETASYDSYGTATTLMAGRIFRVHSHILLPEAGLNWLWTHRQRYTTDATDPAWDTTYSAMDDHDLYAAAALRWLGTFTHDEVRVSPSAAVGVRHLLTDAEADAWQSIPGAAPALVRSERDRTAMTLSGSLTLTEDEHALSLAYDGEYSPDFQRHNLWLRYSWLF